MDVHTVQQRSANMAAIKGKNTGPEMTVRRLLHARGYRYVLHKRGLPGTPDLVFPARHKIVFVHGCYWHMHDCRYGKVLVQTRTAFWQEKRRGNANRDKRNREILISQGWTVLEVWACELKNPASMLKRVTRFLDA